MEDSDKKRKVALITGITGQDGSYLAELLLEKGYEVHGIIRRASTFNTLRIDHLFQDPHEKELRLVLHYGDLADASTIRKLIYKVKPDEIFNLAAQSHVRVSFDIPEYTANITGVGVLRMLEAIKDYEEHTGKKVKFYQASSITFDTPVLIKKDGVIKRTVFGETLELKNFEVLSVDKETKKVKFLPVKRVMNHGMKDVFEVKGRTGLAIRLTADHSLMVFNQEGNIIEKKTSELQEGDHLITFLGNILRNDNPARIKLEYHLDHNLPSRWGYPNKTDSRLVSCDLELGSDFMRVAGYYLAEGCSGIQKKSKTGGVNYRTSFCFGSHEPERVTDTIATIKNVFEVEPASIQRRESSVNITYSSKHLYTFLSRFGHTAKEKRLPDFIWTLPRDATREFLYGYAGDAHFKSGGQIRYTTINKELAIDVIYLMRLHDISTYYIERYNREHLSPQRTIIKAAFCYDIEVPATSNFVVTLPEPTVAKFKSPSAECLPAALFRGERLYGAIHGKQLVSKGRLQRLIALYGLQNGNLLRLVESNLGVIQIKTVNYKGKENVGDYEVPGSECFFCGNQPVLAHNSSEMFGASPPPQNELTPFQPRSPYGIAKLFAYHTTKNYREAYGIFGVNGVLYNHESPRRGETFVTRKITRGIARILAGLDKKIYLGNLEAKRDWGHAPEYMEAAWLMMQQPESDDYVVGTGESHSVREFVEGAFRHAGINDWESYVEIDPRYFRPTEVEHLVADSRKVKEKLGWEAKTKFADLIKIMVDAELKQHGVKKNDTTR